MELDLDFDFSASLKRSHQPRPSKVNMIFKKCNFGSLGVGVVTLILIFENVIDIFDKKCEPDFNLFEWEWTLILIE